jgi:hypothetical protein
LVDAVTVNSF